MHGLRLLIHLNKLIGAAADDSILAGVAGGILDSFPDVLGIHTHKDGGVPQGEIGRPIGHLEVHGGIVYLLHAGDLGEIARLEFVVHQIDRKDDIVNRKWLSIMPRNSLIRGEGSPDGAALVQNLPGGHQVGLHLVILIPHQPGSGAEGIVVHAAEGATLRGQRPWSDLLADADLQLLHHAGGGRPLRLRRSALGYSALLRRLRGAAK